MVNMKDVWSIDMVGRTSAERTGYATQKPEQLINRIIEAFTDEGDIVADFFCGSGTVGAAASKLDRRFVHSRHRKARNCNFNGKALQRKH